MNYWFPDLPQWVTALSALVVMTLVNAANVKAYGEFEFWFAYFARAAEIQNVQIQG